MDYIGEKVIRLQDAKFKLHRNNNNETSIFISGPLAQNLGLVEGSTRKFFIEKFNLIKLLCFTFSFHKPLYKKEVVNLDLLWFDKYLSLINKHFEHTSEFSFDVRKQSQDRFYFISIEQSSGLNIRDLFIQDHVKIIFYSGEDNIIRIEFSDEIISDDIIVKTQENIEDTVVIEDSVIRQFALKSIKHMVSLYGETFLNESLGKVSESQTEGAGSYKSYLFPNYFNQSLLYSFENEPEKTDSRTFPRFVSESLNVLGQKFIYLTTEWAYSGKSNLLFAQLVKFIEDFSNGQYSAKRSGTDGPFFLIRKFNSTDFNLNNFEEHLENTGLIFSKQIIQRFIASLCTKPFVICSGLSGSGKTKLAQAFAKWISKDNTQYVIVPVGADWTNREPILGYVNALKKDEYELPENGALSLMLRAKQNFENPDESTKPYFLILDEMNLSHVERYFADFLSTMESGEAIPLHKLENELKAVPQLMKLPKNLFIIGTVNIDETTYMFSPKVLDRANTIEFRLTEANLGKFIREEFKLNIDLLEAKGATMSDSFMSLALQETDRNLVSSESDLKLFFTELKKSGAEFGYRTAGEIGRLMHMLKELGEVGDNLLDIAIMQKLLPKLHGSRNKLTKVLPILGGFCLKDKSRIKEDYLDKFLDRSLAEVDLQSDPNVKFKISFDKICRMYKNAVENGFASYAEA